MIEKFSFRFRKFYTMEAKDEKKEEEEVPKYMVEEIDAKVNKPQFSFSDFNAIKFDVYIQCHDLIKSQRFKYFLGIGTDSTVYFTIVTIGSLVINSS